MVTRVEIIGPESSGKSTFAQQLATALNATYVAEYARTYLKTIGNNYQQSHLINIAQGQFDSEQNANGAIIICDTGMHNIRIWSEIKYNNCALEILNMCRQSHYTHTIISKAQEQWYSDPLREYPSYEHRHWLQQYYEADAQLTGRNYTVLDLFAPDAILKATNLIMH